MAHLCFRISRVVHENDVTSRRPLPRAPTHNNPLQDQPDRSRPYLTLTLRGSGVFPRLSFDVDEVTLPTVPLGVTSRAMFYAINNGYDSLELTYRLPLHVPVPIEVHFPEGKTLGITMERLPVVLAFRSTTPVSFATKVEILDTDGNRYAVGVCGSADNCVLTTFPFLEQYVWWPRADGPPP